MTLIRRCRRDTGHSVNWVSPVFMHSWSAHPAFQVMCFQGWMKRGWGRLGGGKAGKHNRVVHSECEREEESVSLEQHEYKWSQSSNSSHLHWPGTRILLGTKKSSVSRNLVCLKGIRDCPIELWEPQPGIRCGRSLLTQVCALDDPVRIMMARQRNYPCCSPSSASLRSLQCEESVVLQWQTWYF